MKQKIYKGIFVTLFLLLSLALTVGMAVFGPSKAASNEQLAQKPALYDGEGNWNENYLSQLADWVNDGFFLRQELISGNNWLSANLLASSDAEDVIAGSDGWLYYTPTLPDYTGTGAMSDRELFSAAKNLQLMAEFCESQGKEFVFAIAPNKNSLYPENMPDYGITAEQTNASRLMALLSSNRVKTADLFSAFAKETETLYFAHDSHWNSKGAALGADVINGAFGIASDYYGGDFSKQQPHQGDLYEMLYPAFTDPETDPVYGGTLIYTHTGGGKKPDSMTIKTQGQGRGDLLVYRDSFGNLLYPYLADSAGQATFSRAVSYDLTLPADRVLVELVERNLSYLTKYAPVMPSPTRELSVTKNISGTTAVTFSDGKAPEGMVKLTGVLPTAADDTSSVYLVCDGKVYEAFCLENGGYCAYVPENAQPQTLIYTVSGFQRGYEILQNR